MDFIERLQVLAKKAKQLSSTLTTEEATKNALIMPFLHSVLGYDVFDPTEVVPEYTADTGTKKGEKVDYALIKDSQIQMLIECKKVSETLSLKHAGQLYRYFSVTNARIAILTNGIQYQFYTDLDAPNKMDEKPFLILDLTNLDEHIIPEIKKLTKASFDVESVVDAAGELKYLNQIKKVLSEQFSDPCEDFVKFFTAKVYDGIQTPKIKSQFMDLTRKALKQFLNDSVKARLQSAIVSSDSDSSTTEEIESKPQDIDTSLVVTTEEEIEGFNIVKAILRTRFDVTRICARDTQSYFGILLDDNNRKPLCRLRFNTKQKYLSILDESRKEVKYPIDNLDQIFDHADLLLSVAKQYE